MKKPARWEVVLMIVAFVGMAGALNWRRLQAERDTLKHSEAMERIEEMRLGVASAIPVAKWLNTHLDSHNLAILDYIYGDAKAQKNAQLLLKQDWQVLDSAKLVEALACCDSAKTKERLIALLTEQTGQKFAGDQTSWDSWIAQQKIGSNKAESASYLDFKALLYHRIDPRLVHHFAVHKLSSVPPHEIYWAGLRAMSVPLRQPLLLSANQADYLKPDDFVFGIATKDGLALALPRRIVKWHNIVETELGNLPLTVVYDDDNKSMVAYDMSEKRFFRKASVSPFLYKGEHLVSEATTHSLWSVRAGKPLVYDQSLDSKSLSALPVVSSTWATWVKEHPTTKVLPLETGFDRDYGSK